MPRNPSRIELCNDCVVVFANNTRNEYYFDIADLPLIDGVAWNEDTGRDYLIGYINGKIISAHKLIVGNVPNGFEIDHKDRNKRNNRRCNLRIIEVLYNRSNSNLSRRNKSGFKGVTKSPSGKWYATISHNRKHIHIGTFDCPESAAKAYDDKAIELKGEYAATNEKLGLL